MKKHIIPILFAVTAVFAAFLTGLFFGRKIPNPPVQISAEISSGPIIGMGSPDADETIHAEVSYPIDINTASLNEIMTLPGIGEVLGQRIIDYRALHGPFSSPEDLMKIDGISEKRFETVKDYITIGG